VSREEAAVSRVRRVLTGIKPTGLLHLGNFVGAIKPALSLAQLPDVHAFYFIADFHALTSPLDPGALGSQTYAIAAAWLAMGLDPERTVFYRQSRVPEVLELYWILACLTPKGLMNRAHAYKAALTQALERGQDGESGVLMGLFNYPILMAADILLYKAHEVPVGRDQIQHLEITRDLGVKFNLTYGAATLVIPEAVQKEDVPLLTGLDGRKMSKSYHNTIPLFCPPEVLRSLVFKIKTNSLPPQAPKDPEGCTLFQIYRAFATPAQITAMETRYAEGIGWGEMKEIVFITLNETLSPARAHYDALMADTAQLEAVLGAGEEKARLVAQKTLNEVRATVGF